MAKRRRSNGEGSIRQRGSSYEASVMVGRNPDGSRKVKYFSAPTRAEARRKMQAYLDARDRGQDMDTEYSLEQWINIYLEIHSANIKVSTAEGYKYTRNLIIKHLNKPINKIRPIDIERLLLQLREEGRSDSALAQTRGLLYSVMNKAVGNGLIASNPVAYASKLRKRPPNEKEVYTKEDYRVLIPALREKNTLIAHSIVVLVTCGLRCQEILGLTHDCIEPDGSAIHIRQAVSMERGHVTISTPKSYSSYRTVPVPSIARESALFLRNVETHYVWQSPVADKPEKPVNPSHFRRLYRECLESIPGIKYLPPHNCRHSYVSLLMSQNTNPSIVQSLAGHSTQAMTAHYTHINFTTAEATVAEAFTSITEEA